MNYDERDDPHDPGIVPSLRRLEAWIKGFQIIFWGFLTLIFVSYLAFIVLRA